MLKFKKGKFNIGGDEVVMRRKWSAAATCDMDASIRSEQKKNKNLFIAILAGLLASAVLALTSLAPQPLPSTERNSYGGETKQIETEVAAEYEGESIRKRVSVSVLPSDANPSEIRKNLDDLKERLPEIILGDNKDASDIRSDLNLIEHDEESGADIIWTSDNEKTISDDGSINHIEGKAGSKATLSAAIRLGEASENLDIDITLGKPPDAYKPSKDLESSVLSVVDEISSGTDGEKAELPETTEGGINLKWTAPKSSTMVFAPLAFLFFGIIAYRRRYAGTDKAIAAARESVERDFPDFLDKLILLLNAGVVITSAISKIADGYRERAKRSQSRYFHDEILRMEDRIQSSRVSLTSEFAELAARSGRREVMRFSAILADNIDRGSTLCEKLAQESNVLWDMRKKSAEKKGRLAETKLTFPMVLQLVAIILITVAPAAIEMK